MESAYGQTRKMRPENGQISYKIVLVHFLNRLNNSNWMFPESKKSGVKNKLDIPSDFAVYFLRNRTKSHKYSTNFFKNLERKCRMLNSKILVIFNPICLVSVKNRHIDQNQEKIGTKSAYADKYRHADRQIGLTETLLGFLVPTACPI